MSNPIQLYLLQGTFSNCFELKDLDQISLKISYTSTMSLYSILVHTNITENPKPIPTNTPALPCTKFTAAW